MRISIIGAGAMGSLFGAMLSKNNEVCLYSHNKAYVKAVSENGLIMTRGEEKQVLHLPVTDKPEEVMPSDVALVFVKSTGLRSAIEDAKKNCITPDTLVVCLQNGIGNVDIARELLPLDQIAYGFSVMKSDMKAPGHIEVTSNNKMNTCFQVLAPEARPKAEALVEALRGCGLSAEMPENIDAMIWQKLLINCTLNPLCSILKIYNGDVMLNTPEAHELGKALIFEVSDVARAKGINISRSEALDFVMKTVSAGPRHIPSMAQDVLKEKYTEIGSLNEAVVAEGKRLGVPTPMNEIIIRFIRAIEKNYGNFISLKK